MLMLFSINFIEVKIVWPDHIYYCIFFKKNKLGMRTADYIKNKKFLQSIWSVGMYYGWFDSMEHWASRA
jgi:hypothetical protein